MLHTSVWQLDVDVTYVQKRMFSKAQTAELPAERVDLASIRGDSRPDYSSYRISLQVISWLLNTYSMSALYLIG